jgi:hypothetical protein
VRRAACAEGPRTAASSGRVAVRVSVCAWAGWPSIDVCGGRKTRRNRRAGGAQSQLCVNGSGSGLSSTRPCITSRCTPRGPASSRALMRHQLRGSTTPSTIHGLGLSEWGEGLEYDRKNARACLALPKPGNRCASSANLPPISIDQRAAVLRRCCCPVRISTCNTSPLPRYAAHEHPPRSNHSRPALDQITKHTPKTPFCGCFQSSFRA